MIGFTVRTGTLYSAHTTLIERRRARLVETSVERHRCGEVALGSSGTSARLIATGIPTASERRIFTA